MTHRARRSGPAAIAITALAAGLSLSPAPAAAAPSAQTQMLCTQTEVPCSIQLSPHQREGAAGQVLVTGRPRLTITLQVFRVSVVDGRPSGITAMNKPFQARTNDKGYGDAVVPFPAMPPDQDGGWVLVAPADTVWTTPAQVLGAIAHYGARRPTLLGDGYGSHKPVGAPLDLQVVNTIGGTRFAVEFLQDDGTWHNVTAGGAIGPVPGGDAVTSISYTVPQGLLPKAYAFRLVNLSDSSAEPQTWAVTPATAPPTQPRLKELDEVILGTDIDGAALRNNHPTRAVMIGMGTLVGAGLVGALGWPAAILARRPRLGRGPAQTSGRAHDRDEARR